MPNHSKTEVVCCLVVFFLAVMGCSERQYQKGKGSEASTSVGQANPTENEGRDALQTWLHDPKFHLHPEAKAKVKSLRKTDGVTRTVFGVPTYEMDFQANIELLEDGYFVDGQHRKGDILTTEGVITFEKREKGWRLDSVGGFKVVKK